MPKKLLKPQTLLIPLPAVMVSCQRKNEKPNITKFERNELAKLVELLVRTALEREHD